MPLLQLRNVRVDQRLGPIDGQVLPGELIHLVGPNGAGKSTLLARMAGLGAGQGEILFNGVNLDNWSASALAQRRGWLMQQQPPPFTLPVWHYLQLHQSCDGSEPVMLSLAADLYLTDKLTRQVTQLSGGEWQRVRLAALFLQVHPTLNQEGQLLLLDEPLASLDVAQQARLDRVLRYFCEAGIAIVMSSHDLNHSLRYADQVWLMRQGNVLAQGEPERVLTPDRLHQAYDIDFRLLSVEGHHLLFSEEHAASGH